MNMLVDCLSGILWSAWHPH